MVNTAQTQMALQLQVNQLKISDIVLPESKKLEIVELMEKYGTTIEQAVMVVLHLAPDPREVEVAQEDKICEPEQTLTELISEIEENQGIIVEPKPCEEAEAEENAGTVETEYKQWTEEEEFVLVTNVLKGYGYVAELLPHRTLPAIRAKGYELGIRLKTYSKRFFWSKEEVMLLIKYQGVLTPKELAAIISRTESAVHNKLYAIRHE